MKTRYLLPVVLFCLLILNARSAFAQTTSAPINIDTLTRLHEAWLQDPENDWVNKRIEDERSDIRKLLEEKILATLEISVQTETIEQTDLLRSQGCPRSG